jgi:cell wall-associated NlpC family hydrolase
VEHFLKKGLTLGLALACTFGCTSSVFAANKGKINADNVNIRTQANTSSEVMKMLSTGETVTVVANADGWYQLQTAAGGVAYVKQDYVTLTQADGVVTDDFINVRSNPSISSDVVGVVSKGQAITVTGVVNDEWYSVFYNGQSAYVHCDYLTGDMLPYVKGATAKSSSKAVSELKIEDGMYALVTSTSLNLREEPSTDSNVIKRYDNGYALSILGTTNGWLQVCDDDGVTGYVKSDYISLKNGTKPENATTKKESSSSEIKATTDKVEASADAVEMIEFAKQFIGTPYVYGGTDLTSGVDCSGFTYSVYKQFGIVLDRRSRDQINDGEFVDKEDLQAGDLVFFNTGGDSEISHVGMYIGGGEYIHSTDGKANGVTISSLNDDYALRTYYGAARILSNED